MKTHNEIEKTNMYNIFNQDLDSKISFGNSTLYENLIKVDNAIKKIEKEQKNYGLYEYDELISFQSLLYSGIFFALFLFYI